MPRSIPSLKPSDWICGFLVAAAVFVAYVPVWRAGFVWDDDAHVTASALRSWSGLERIWTEPGATQQYYPLLHSVFWVEHRLWGDAAIGYHLANVGWHALAAILAGLALRRLTVPGAWLAAAVFALHPVQVESVAWISEQKNTLSAVFYFGAALAYLRFDEHRSRRSYLLGLVLFVLGLLTKTVVATLPAALWVVLWWRKGKLSWRTDIVPLIPWLLLGISAGLFTAWVEARLVGAEGTDFDLSLVQRALLAGRVVWFYLGKLSWPAALTFVYPRWTISAGSIADWLPLVGCLAATLGLWAWRVRSRAPLAAWLFFVGTLFPVLGFFSVYPFRYSFVADHFQYLACLGPFALAMGAVTMFSIRTPAWIRGASVIAGLVSLGVLTWRQSQDYRDAVSLYRATIQRNPTAWMAWNNLGKELMSDPARRNETIACFQRAIELHSEYYEAQNNLGLALTQARRAEEAIPHLEAALRLKPNSYQACNNLGIALASTGRAGESLALFRRAAELNPAMPNLEENWGKALRLLGRETEAEIHFARAARLRER